MRRALLPIVVVTLCVSSASSRPRELTLQERIEAQRSIDRVYYQHQEGATQPFESAVPTSVLEKKVHTYLKQSAALEKFWRNPVDAQTLRDEWERIARESRLPDRLREIYAALGNDSFLIQECFVRPVLVERLTRKFLAFDPRVQGPPRENAERLRRQLASGALDPWKDQPGRQAIEIVVTRQDERDLNAGSGPVHATRVELSEEEFRRTRDSLPGRIGEIGPLQESPEAFTFSAPLEGSAEHLLLASYRVEKVDWEAWSRQVGRDIDESEVRPVAQGASISVAPGNHSQSVSDSSPVPMSLDSATGNTGCIPADSWTRGMEEDIPDGRAAHTAVWTGTEMLIWGGYTESNSNTQNAVRGNRYDPLTDTWRMISPLGAPSPRSGHSAVWTGSRMVVWGGGASIGSSVVASGGRYDPISDTWSGVSATGAPSARSGHTAVWTGTRMVVWGGRSGSTDLAEGGRYDPVTDTWAGMSASGLVGRTNHSAIWTGSRMIVWGGQSGSGATVLGDGGLYDPAGDAWNLNIATFNRPSNRRRHTAVWTGSRMIIWGGDAGNSLGLNNGGLYNPVANSWAGVSASSSGRTNHRAIWTGTKMLVWGGQNFSTSLNTGGLFNPAANSWQATSTAGAPFPRFLHSMIWTGSLAIVWGGAYGDPGGYLRFDGGRYNPETDSWTPTSSTPDGPIARSGNGIIWTGSHLIVWGGTDAWRSQFGTVVNSGSRYDPITDSWSETSRSDVPSARTAFMTAWAGNRMVVWGGAVAGAGTTATGGRYDPIANSWQSTSQVGAPPPRAAARGIGAGSRVFVLGWSRNYSPQFNGFLYDPAADSWATVSTLHQPQPCDFYSMIWTGTEVIVWGGMSVNGGVVTDTGGKYDPGGDQWIQTDGSGVPSPRQYHSAVWTGSEMLIWGGRGSSGIPVGDGARYDPSSNQWNPLPGSGPPASRSSHVAVWTGSEMIIWGGRDELSALNSGGRYDPVTEQWTPTSTLGAPPASVENWSAFWSGQFMLVWGGLGPNIGGVYAPEQVDGDRDGDGFLACSGDCDDSDPDVHPGALESCNGRDDDCNGVADDGFPDADADGVAVCAGDCDDADASVRPGIPEACDLLDNNCNGLVNEGLDDLDRDGYPGCGIDCDDTRTDVHVGAPEICDGRDNDCNGLVDDGVDQDGDGYIAAACGGADCNDTNPDIHPGAPELCNGIDDDCDLSVDESLDQDGDGYTQCTGDCNDANPMVHPFAAEVCNGIDDDCDASIDEGFDQDGDGYGPCTGDCNDANPEVHPGALEICNGIDDNCDGHTDDADLDGDGFAGCTADCYDFDPTVWAAPVEISNLTLAYGHPTLISWEDQGPLSGTATQYDLISGGLGPSPGIFFTASECLQSMGSGFSYYDSRPDPGLGSTYWYLSRASNICGVGTYGEGTSGSERVSDSCP